MNQTEVHLVDKTPKSNINYFFHFLHSFIFLLLLPAIIAYGGWKIHSKIAENGLNKDYVAISVSILTRKDLALDDELRNWAVEILNMHAPIKLPENAISRLKSGDSLFGKANLNIKNGDLLVLKSGFQDKAIIEISHKTGCIAEYKWIYINGINAPLFGSGLLFENYEENHAGESINKGQIMIVAGPFKTEWSCNSSSAGWVYPNPYSTEIIPNTTLEKYVSSL